MLTIGQLAAYGEVSVRTVRHYHQIGLLPEPERDNLDRRTYDASAVVRLVRVRTLAGAGVPLARIQELLEASPQTFAQGVAELDQEMGREIRRLQETRKRLARLASGENLVLPASVVDYLGRLRELGVQERYVALERDAWIMVAARAPDQIELWIAQKHRELEDPDMIQLYQLLSEAVDWQAGHPRVVELVDVLERLLHRAVEAGSLGTDDLDQTLVDLLDSTTLESAPITARMIALLEERGWKGWTRVERVPT
jgi:DNA-binding transcriptional MerR regulator